MEEKEKEKKKKEYIKPEVFTHTYLEKGAIGCVKTELDGAPLPGCEAGALES